VRRWAWSGAALLLVTTTGCARSLTIRQDKYINTAPYANRSADQQTGDPLELTVVVVYPDDLKHPENELLKPDSKITAKDWEDRRPLHGQAGGSGRFVIPQEQIFLLTNAERYYGRKIGNALRGAAHDGDKPLIKSGIALNWGHVHDSNTVIYVFPRFIGRDGSVLPALPAEFNPPGAYTSALEVQVGVQPNARSPEEAQFIKVLSERKLYGSESK
jgi:hypothetical protein